MDKTGMEQLIGKAQVLIEALPYIRRFSGKTFVIKYGGQAMASAELKDSVAQDIVLLKYIGINPIVVHGGGKEITTLLERLKIDTRFVGGLRVTDRETMELVEMVLVGKINKEVVSLLNRHGGRAVGLSGKDSNLLMARRRPPAQALIDGAEQYVDLGYVGDITEIKASVIETLSQNNYIPVIAPVAVSLEGEGLNVNADHVAGELAAALKAEKLIMLTDVEGILSVPDRLDTLLSTVTRQQARDMMISREITSGMIPKVEACIRALNSGVCRTHIIDGRLEHSMLLEIFTDTGIGTMVE